MKRFLTLISLLLVVSLLLPMTASASEMSTRRASDYFAADSCYLQKVSSTELRVWFDVTGLAIMEEIGTSVIIVQRSSDGSKWEDMKTYTKENYPEMIAYNTGVHADYVTYSATPGYYYRAYVRFYAKRVRPQAQL